MQNKQKEGTKDDTKNTERRKTYKAEGGRRIKTESRKKRR
jgi:hypothetical protein